MLYEIKAESVTTDALQRRLAAVVLASMVSISPWSALAVAADDSIPQTLPVIIQEWEARQQETTSLNIEWTSRETFFAETIPLRMLKHAGSRAYGPPKDVTCVVTHELVVNGHESKYIARGQRLNPVDGSTATLDEVSVFDGSTKSTRIDHPSNDRGHGVMEDVDIQPAFMNIGVRPICFQFWPLTRKMGGWDSADLTLTGETARIDGHTCAVVTVTRQYANGTVDRLFVDVDSGSCIRRAVHLDRKGRLISQTDMDYTDSEGRFQLSTWAHQQFTSKGKLSSLGVCTVSSQSHSSGAGPAITVASAGYEAGDIVTTYRDGSPVRTVVDATGAFVPEIELSEPTHWVWWLALVVLALGAIVWSRRSTVNR